MTDHKAEALRFAEGCTAEVLAAVHSTLYLAEQQRIANLIAITDLRRNQVAGNQLYASTETVFDHPADDFGGYRIKPEIAAALGIPLKEN